MAREGRKVSALRKGTALSLSLAMALSCVPAQAFAVGVDHEEEGVYLPVFSDSEEESEPTEDITVSGNPEEESEPAEDIAASGEWGTCHWEIDAKGKLTVYPGEGADTECFAPWNWYRTTITSIVLASNDSGDKVILPSDSSSLFAYLDAVTTIDLTGADTSRVKCMCSMFDSCPSLTSLDLSGFDTSEVTDMSWMFRGCSSLTSLDLSGFDTSSVTDMTAMFHKCSSLESVDLSSFDTSNVTEMGWMFWVCPNLASIDLSNFNTSNVKRMNFMFRDCSSLTSLDLSGFDTSNLREMNWMFQNCSSLSSLDLSSFDTSNVTGLRETFRGCSSLTSLDLSSFDTSNVTEMRETFRGCSSLTSLDLSNFDTSKVNNMNSMFMDCTELETITVGRRWSTANVKLGDEVFSNCTSLKGGSGTNFDSANVSSECAHADVPETTGYLTLKTESGVWGTCPWELDTEGVLTVHSGKGDNTEGTSPWSELDDSITKVVFVADEDGDKVILPSDSSSLFEGIDQLISVDLSGADTTRVTNMGRMFRDCSSLTSLSLSGLDTSKVTSMGGMFYNCPSLVSLDLSDLNTSSVRDMNGMFDSCSSLASLDLSSFNTRSVTDMSWMFCNCSSLASLDLSNFETPKLENMSVMFAGCTQLKTITVGEGWSTKGVSASSGDNVFLACISLRGANGTTYDGNHTDYRYARVDVPEATGYLTQKVGEAPVFKTANLTVGNQIGLAFWLELPEADGLDYGDAYVEFSIKDKIGRTEKVALTEETPRDKEGLCGFTFNLTSVEMAEPVTATFHYSYAGEERTVSMSYSVQDYFEDFDKVAESHPKETVNLVHAAADLGFYMQPYLASANKWTLGDDYAQITKRYATYDDADLDKAADGLKAYGIEAELGDSGVKASASASFDSLTAINVFLTAPDGSDIAFQASLGNLAPRVEKLPDGRWLVRVEGISPQLFDQSVNVTGTCNGKNFSLKASVLGLLNAGFSKADDEAKAAFASAYFSWQASRQMR